MHSSQRINAVIPELSIVVPTFNESENVPELVSRLDKALQGIAWEVIFVDDDSPDGTACVAKKLSTADARVRCIRRVGRRGLSGACIEGILSSSAPTVAVMDADLQHEETILPTMYMAIRSGADIAVGSRYCDGRSSSKGLSEIRQWGSDTATKLARHFLKINLSDPMSGFFMIRREIVENLTGELASQGFKILLDIIASTSEKLNIIEIPFSFGKRINGESKLDTLVTAEYLGLIVSKLSGGALPIRFLMFAIVGLSGLIVHLAFLIFVSSVFALGFSFAQFAATVVAMTWNFILNNQLTYRDRRLKGLSFVYGLVTFYILCSLGTFANVGVASWLYGFEVNLTVAGLAGAVIGSVFNYSASSTLTWRK